MADDLTRGICFFAYNNEQIDYIKITALAALAAKKHLDLPVCVITDAGTEAWMFQSMTEEFIDSCFDYVVTTNDEMRENIRGHFDSPWTEFRAQFSNSNKHKIFEYSPFEQTLMLDVDYIVNNDFLLSAFEQTGVAMYDRALGLRNNMPHPREQRLYDNGVKMWWSTVIYFDRSETSQMFFDTWAHVADNYEYYQYLYNFPGHMFRTDYCVSVAVHIMNGMQEGDAIGTFSDCPMIYMDQKDDIIEVKNDWIYLAHSPEEPWLNILVKNSYTDVHVMNKRALGRVYDEAMDFISDN